MPASDIVVKGARENNLCDVDLTLPRNRLICLTGVSGSGKSSFAFDTLYAEGQRRYIESLSSFARQFLGQLPKPDVDYISGLSPSISISQKSAGNNPRSTVGTITEIYDYLRVLYARAGTSFCPDCGNEITAQTREQILTRILSLPAGTRFTLLAPLIRQQKGEYRDLCEDLLKQGFVRARVDGEIVSLSDNLQLDRQMRHDIEVVVDRLAIKDDVRPRLAEAAELALRMGKGTMIVAVQDGESAVDTIYSTECACLDCGKSFSPLSPQLFSFNSPQGMCPQCDGLGELYSFDPELLVPDGSLSFKEGAVETVGRWKELGRWRRHIYNGVADTMERKHGWPAGTLLESPWRELLPQQQDILLAGTGDEHITFTWRAGRSPLKYGGPYHGIIPDLLGKYRNSKSRIQIRRLEAYMTTLPCAGCGGERLVPQARAVGIATAHPQFTGQPFRSLPELCELTVQDASDFFAQIQLDDTKSIIAAEVLKEIRARLGFLLNVGLDYLTLNRTAPTLSGGESQRIRLAGQIGSGLVGVMYILDEPSIGLHPRDNDRLLESLQQLRDMGNTVVVVEHDEDTMLAADHIVDFGPGPGIRGGKMVVAGNPRDVQRSKESVTGQFLAGKRKISVPLERRAGSGQSLVVRQAAHNNLKNIDADIPLGKFVCVTGVSGSGKSSLVNDILVESLRRDLNKGNGDPGAHAGIDGLEHLDKLIAIDQSPIGRTPRSNPGTYIKVFDDIRNLFMQLPDAKKRGYKAGRFSFNVKGGRCEACEGNGSNKLEMDFLADVWVTCPVCQGKRFNRETLQVMFKDKSVSDVLEMDVQEALGLFENIPKVHHKLSTLQNVGLDYLKIGQPSPTLSGGEAQRIKLARELVKKSTGQTLYLLDEPTTGLHFADIEMLLKVLHDFVDAGNTVLVVEHNLDVIKTADWIIDLGPEGGVGGGTIVAAGPPEEVAQVSESHTGRCLTAVLGNRKASNGNGATRRGARQQTKPAKRGKQPQTRLIKVEGASQHNLRGVSAEIARDKMTVFCGPSGSGKTSLAMDTIYAEGQRRYVESLSAYARQFVSQMQKPQLEHIEGLSPAIAIEQKNLGHTPRSTVGTVTEIYDYLRILFARVGVSHCPACEVPVGTQTSDEIVDKILALPNGTRLFLMAPIEIAVGEKYETLWEDLRKSGYARVRVDGLVYELDKVPKIDRRRKHDVEVVVDRIIVKGKARSRIADSVEHALSLGSGVINLTEPNDDVAQDQWDVQVHSQHLACHQCGQSFDPLTPHSFSFNSSLGWCPSCEGLGVQTGANLSAIVDGKRTLLEGALRLWPACNKRVSQMMLTALSRELAIPLDVPFQRLTTRHRRMLLHGTDDRWFSVYRRAKPKRNEIPVFRFQFKGLYPSLEEASRLSPAFRAKLESFVDEVDCSACSGSRLREDASAVRLQGQTIDQIGRLPLGELLSCVQAWQFDERERRVAGELLREVENRLQFLNDVGLHYLTLSRSAASLSNGEAQRIRLASQLGSGLCGVLYVLDEPTIGLHPRDNRRLLGALHKLRDLGNTLLIVEHDRDVIAGADYLCDFGPGAGKLGGEIVAHGTPKATERRRSSVTGPYLSGKKTISVPTNRRMIALDLPKVKEPATAKAKKAAKKKAAKTKTTEPVGPQRPDECWKEFESPGIVYEPPTGQWLEVVGARHNNLKDVNVRFPLGTLTAVTGPSGSGKSSLINDVVYAALAKVLHRAAVIPGPHQELRGLEGVNKVIRVDQQPLGNSPASNPATYTGAFDLIRTLFSQLPDSRLRGYTARRFSFNVPGGRCDYCEGYGQRCIEMHFLPDVWVTCETCNGQRYNPETLAVTYRGRSIAEVLELTCGEALELFQNIPKIRRILQTLCDVGLDYLTLGQSAPTLSGGEAQRVKLAAELSRPDTGRTLYLLDEPTTGLHFDDLVKLLAVMNRLVDLGNTVVVIEHNLDVIKCADWLVDMGPDAGEDGGQLVCAGTPEQLVEFARTSGNQCDTGIVLGETMASGTFAERDVFDPHADLQQEGDVEIEQVGQATSMPWESNGQDWHTNQRVDRKGEPCQWEGRVLSDVIERIQQHDGFAETDWNSRSIVEITGTTKSQGWFLHAITAETWQLKLKFRVARNTFKQADLQQRIPLKSLNEMHELPVYGNEPRVRCKNIRGPWQEVELRIFNLEEVNGEGFWTFVDEAVAGFFRQTTKASADPDSHAPWKKLGQKWHFGRQGFPAGKRVHWDMDVWEKLHALIGKVSPDAKFVWTNKILVRVNLPQQRLPWAYVNTKRADFLELMLVGPKNGVTLGEFAELGHDREMDGSRPDYDLVRIHFRSKREIDELFEEFLIKHLGQREFA